MKKCFLLCFICFAFAFKAQNRQVGGGFSNNVTSFPFKGYPALFNTTLHPGVDVKIEQQLNSKEKNQWWCKGEVGVFYHRFFQTAVKLNLGISYNYCFTPRFNTMLGFEGGYTHSFYQYELYKLNIEGDYVKATGVVGRPQFNAGFYWGAAYGLLKNDPQKLRLYLQFKTFAQGIFAGSYIPVVPYNHISLGLTCALKPKEKKNEK